MRPLSSNTSKNKSAAIIQDRLSIKEYGDLSAREPNQTSKCACRFNRLATRQTTIKPERSLGRGFESLTDIQGLYTLKADYSLCELV